ncbi:MULTISPECIES: Gfo/Idh/MocA family protein [Clostridium]|jgi:predicted dehydrogenase|uniref:Gfo/Idh/MocA family protein n=1 Tax=Clostridium TaxID=1485 RepID=UPI00115B906B|nr:MULTISPECIES: Gfo/Idh/MocA family oxidoreductase [Clostridium]MBS5306655.1 Gfo/Idh/MocA family oxidoreductase [Clostridium sp.]MDB1944675.1 Gfo/Idh/MocA family oxidoreductase [Clostridium tertium]MDB1952143.1 Gfo/Idh/MocA family oxidoreductase [Clostridium tertium]MDB1969025.1 Gfo/Idh/MocA family oxidoreductase [Clostridium tertium]MDU1277405.1 Gfo/Idh/MocA family oxidoreductase [Clostridium sp.]
MAKLKSGVVGAGIYGLHHVKTYLFNDDIEKVVFCDLNKDLREKVEKEYNIKGYESVSDMLDNEDLDIVSIATPDPYHFEPAKLVIERGIDVLIEKPLATSVEECEELVRLAKEKNVRVAVDFHKRWDPAYIAIKDEAKKEESGKFIRGYMSLDDVIDVPMKWFNWAHKSSPAWFLGVHCYDIIRFITDSEVKEVFAVGNKGLLESKGIDSYDSVQAILKMEDGSNWVVENSWIIPNGFPKANDGQLVILTENRYFKNESYRGLNYYTPNTPKIPNYIFMDYKNGKASGFGLDPIKDFIKDVKSGNKFIADEIDGLKATLIAAAVHKSLETGEVVKL